MAWFASGSSFRDLVDPDHVVLAHSCAEPGALGPEPDHVGQPRDADARQRLAVPPLGCDGRVVDSDAGPAMSTWTHGVSLANVSKNRPAVIAPPNRSPVLRARRPVGAAKRSCGQLGPPDCPPRVHSKVHRISHSGRHLPGLAVHRRIVDSIAWISERSDASYYGLKPSDIKASAGGIAVLGDQERQGHLSHPPRRPRAARPGRARRDGPAAHVKMRMATAAARRSS